MNNRFNSEENLPLFPFELQYDECNDHFFHLQQLELLELI